MTKTDDRSPVLPTDSFDQALARLVGLPNGASTQPTVVQTTDFYGKTTQHVVQTVKHDEGESVFLTEITGEGTRRFVVPPKVVATMLRQRDAVSTIVRRRLGRRLAEERKASGVAAPTFTPEMRKKALATRKKNAAARRARKAAK